MAELFRADSTWVCVALPRSDKVGVNVKLGVGGSGVTTAPAYPASRGGHIAAPEPTNTLSRYNTCLLMSGYQVYFHLNKIRNNSKIRFG